MPVSQEHNFSQITDVALDNIIRDVLTLAPQSDGCPNTASTTIIHCHYLRLDSDERWLHLRAPITFSLKYGLPARPFGTKDLPLSLLLFQHCRYQSKDPLSSFQFLSDEKPLTAHN